MKSFILFLCVIIISGCALFSSNDRPGYQAGRTTAVIWMATEGIQPKELHEASIIGYKVLEATYINNNASGIINDDIILKEIDKISKDFTPLQKQLVINFYNMAKNRLNSEIKDKSIKLVVLNNFVRGIADALNDYSFKK
jgi:hypothetical protein